MLTSQGGVWYENFEEFSEGLVCLQEGHNSGVLGRQGWRLVKESYSWPVIERAYLDTVDKIQVQSGEQAYYDY